MYAIRSSDTLHVYDAYLYRDGLKNIPGRYFDADDKAWVLPYTDEAVRTLELLGARLGDGIEPSSQSKAVAKKYETISTQPRVKATLYARTRSEHIILRSKCSKRVVRRRYSQTWVQEKHSSPSARWERCMNRSVSIKCSSSVRNPSSGYGRKSSESSQIFDMR